MPVYVKPRPPKRSTVSSAVSRPVRVTYAGAALGAVGVRGGDWFVDESEFDA